MILNNKFKSLAFGATTAVITAMAMLPGSAQAATLTGRVNLSDLLVAGNSYQLGDKLFNNFRDFTSTATGGGRAPSASGIVVEGVINPGGQFTLNFQSSWSAVIPGSTSNTNFTYDVTVLDPNQVINRVGLALTGYGVNNGGQITAEDTITKINPGGAPQTLSVLSTSGSDIATAFLIPSQRKISVTKELSLTANTGTAAISGLSQSVFQTTSVTSTPESGNVLGILALGGLGLTLASKKLKVKNTNVG